MYNDREEEDSPNCSFFGYGLLVLVQQHLHLFAVAPPMHPRNNNESSLLAEFNENATKLQE